LDFVILSVITTTTTTSTIIYPYSKSEIISLYIVNATTSDMYHPHAYRYILQEYCIIIISHLIFLLLFFLWHLLLGRYNICTQVPYTIFIPHLAAIVSPELNRLHIYSTKHSWTWWISVHGRVWKRYKTITL
jgi:hypothetical protein